MRKSVLIGLGALVAVAALFAACGGSDDKGGSGDQTSNIPGNIRIAKGLTVANLSSGNGGSTSGQENLALTQGAGGAAPAADSSARSASTGNGGGLGGDGGSSLPQQASNQTDNTGITIQGYGSATADADSAVVEFGFGTNGGSTPYPVTPDSNVKPEPATTSAATITKEKLQSVIDALTGAGVAAADIELLSQGYYDAYSSYGTLRATIKNVDAVDGAVQAAQTAANNLSGIYLQSTNVSYTLQDCTTLERASSQAAVEDAHDRAVVLADVLNVTLGSVSGASDYSYYQYGTGCGSNYYSPYPIAYTPWRAGGAGDGTVQVVSNISVTYAFQ